MVQEALANIARHARAHAIWVTLQQQERVLLLEIRDDGQGFDPATVQRGMGLVNLSERAAALNGTLTLESQPGAGTSISVRIPLLSPPEEQAQQQQQILIVKRDIARVYSGVQTGELYAWMTIALMIIGLSFYSFGSTIIFILLVIFGICATATGFLQANSALTRVVFYRGVQDLEVQDLRIRLRGWRFWALRLAALVIWYLTQAFNGLQYQSVAWLLIVLACLFLVLFSVERISTARQRKAYYALLPAAQAQWEIAHMQATLRMRFKRWLLGLGFYLLFTVSMHSVLWPPRAPLQILDYAVGIVLLIWGGLILLETRYFQREMLPLAQLDQVSDADIKLRSG
ncbi:sensor histidine kinase [Dictyobacter kobayashii]|uniref:histidine kinase n=1 Tax=Dictyobacter kobayashii TaxID=2014872 RepID=A0A402APX3_9CHLR|nr:ATP-binding protein [Dictyobacter kobayashii]GCE21213.1 hypothetical protein KDK_50130 [Dictyobacter kobayashii]